MNKGLQRYRAITLVILLTYRRLCTAPDKLSRLSRLRLKKSGQRKLNRYTMSRLSLLVPTIFKLYRMEKRRRSMCDGGQKYYSRAQNVYLVNKPTESLRVLSGLFTCGYDTTRNTARVSVLKFSQHVAFVVAFVLTIAKR